MKNKIFKALGVGAVATLGLFTFTGCSLSDSEKAKLMNELDNATEYMEETIDQLKEQNKKLKEQNQTAKLELEESKKENDILQNYLEELQNENAKITAKEAFNKLLIAEYKLNTNYEGIRNNLKIIGTENNDNNNWYAEYVKTFYQSESNGFIYNEKECYENHNVELLVYEYDEKVYGYEKDLEDSDDYSKAIFENYASSETYALRSLGVVDGELSVHDIKSVEILENGNYKITFIFTRNDVISGEYISDIDEIIEYEITRDCEFVEATLISMGRKSKEQGSGYDCEKRISTIRFEYGVITEDYINGLLQEAISRELTE